jgi:hypothetical protein
MEYDYAESTLDINENLWYFDHLCVRAYQIDENQGGREQDFERTGKILRAFLRSVVESGVFSDEEATALKFLTLHKPNPETVEEKVRETSIREEYKEKIAEEIDEYVGIMGGSLFLASIADETTEDSFLSSIEVLLDENLSNEEHDEAVEEILKLDIKNVALGTLSTVFCLLHPSRYPIVNSQSEETFDFCFNLDVSVPPSEYLDAVSKFEKVRDEFGFAEHYSDLDFFCYWANELTDIEEYIQENDIEDRDVWQIGTGVPKDNEPEVLWPIWREEGICSVGWDIGNLNDISNLKHSVAVKNYDGDDGNIVDCLRRIRERISRGDIILAKDGKELLGIGVVQGNYAYCGDYIHDRTEGKVEHPHVRPVEWTVIPEETNTNTSEWEDGLAQGTLKRTKNFEQIRLNLAELTGALVEPLLELEEKVSNPGEGTLPEECFTKTEYFILRTGSDEYEDEPATQYHFRDRIPGYRQLLEAEDVEFLYLEDGFFYGRGRLGSIHSDKRGSETHYFADVGEFEEIEPVGRDEVRNEIKDFPPEHPIVKLPEEDYDTIVSRSRKDLEDLIDAPWFSLEGRPQGLYFEDWEDIRNQIEASLNSGKNIILNGPPGTGKTKIAKWVCEQVAETEDEVDGYEFTTATADWTAFDTIGGYVPSTEEDEEELQFEPRIFLNRFRDEDGVKNEWLVIDEINRSDIDKAFGQLFSVLSEDSVTLPYERDDTVELVWTDDEETAQRVEDNPDKFPVTESWRLIATMNTHDKASLYEMSYAFMRRFNFVHIGVPDIDESSLNPNKEDNFSSEWIDEGISKETIRESYADVTKVWKSVNAEKEIGPSIVRDIFSYLDSYPADDERALTNAVVSLVFPQMEGMRRDEQVGLINSLSDIDTINENMLTERAEDIFRRKFTQDDQDTA